jgi:hypothetical protein
LPAAIHAWKPLASASSARSGSARQGKVWRANYLKGRQAKTELAHINRELKRLKNQIGALEDRKSKLIAAEIQ